LKDFATSKPFKVELPLTMLKQHDPDTMKLKEVSNELVLDVGVGSLDGQWLWRDDNNEKEAGPENTQCDHGDCKINGITEERAWFEIGLDKQNERTKDKIAELQYVLTIANKCHDTREGHKLEDPPSSILDAFCSFG
jgi:hypothetical protein